MSDYQLLRRVSSGMLSRQESVEGGLFHAKYEPKEVLGQWVGREKSMTVLWTLVDPLPPSLFPAPPSMPSPLLPPPCPLLCSPLHTLSFAPPPCPLLCSPLHVLSFAPPSMPSPLLPPLCPLLCSLLHTLSYFFPSLSLPPPEASQAQWENASHVIQVRSMLSRS